MLMPAEPVADANALPQEVSVQLQEMAGDAQQEEDRSSAPPAPPTGGMPFAPAENDQGNNNVPDNELTIAARSGKAATVRTLLESSAATVDERCGEFGEFALMHAATLGHTAIVLMLLEASASVDLLCNKGRTALMWAARNGHTAVVLALLQASASVDLLCNGPAGFSGGCTALMWAARNGHTAVVLALLQASSSVDLRSHGQAGFSALMWAAWFGHASIVRALLQANASVDLQSNLGYTALMVAAWNGRTAVVQALLQASASVDLLSNATDTHGRSTALKFARNRNQVEAILLLQGQSLHTCKAFGLRARAAAARIGTTGKQGAQRIRVSPAKLVEMGPPLTVSNANISND